MVVATWFEGLGGGLIAFLLSIAAVFLWCVLDGASRAPRDVMAAIFALAWIALLGCFAVALLSLDDPVWMVGLLILMPVANDTGGWAFGVVWGKHPMSPSISPKKSWEGFAGSVVCGLAVAMVLVYGRSLTSRGIWHASLLWPPWRVPRSVICASHSSVISASRIWARSSRARRNDGSHRFNPYVGTVLLPHHGVVGALPHPGGVRYMGQ